MELENHLKCLAIISSQGLCRQLEEKEENWAETKPDQVLGKFKKEKMLGRQKKCLKSWIIKEHRSLNVFFFIRLLI